jgi:mRNA-degrading endonuclease RelE of RelBE toxin-antitoxin system
VRVRWSPGAVALAQRFMRDQEGMRAIVAAVDALQDDPYPVEGFHRRDYYRLRVGPYRVKYIIDGDMITIERVDRVI